MSRTSQNVTPKREKKPMTIQQKIALRKVPGDIVRHLILAALAFIWLIPIIWLLFTSFSADPGRNVLRFFPIEYSLNNYQQLLFNPGTVVNFPAWFKNTFIVAVFTCLISSMFVLMIAYTMSCMRFRGRRALMNFGVILGLFPGFLTMIAIYYTLKLMGLTNTHFGLILVYSGASGLGYLIAKGFFDTVPESMLQAARIDGASEATIFWKIILPMSRPIIVYTVISSFLTPWMDFVFANIIIKERIPQYYTVAMGLYRMLDKSSVNIYFAQFCAGGVIVAIPISILFVIMQKFYVESVAGGSVKG